MPFVRWEEYGLTPEWARQCYIKKKPMLLERTVPASRPKRRHYSDKGRNFDFYDIL